MYCVNKIVKILLEIFWRAKNEENRISVGRNNWPLPAGRVSHGSDRFEEPSAARVTNWRRPDLTAVTSPYRFIVRTRANPPNLASCGGGKTPARCARTVLSPPPDDDDNAGGSHTTHSIDCYRRVAPHRQPAATVRRHAGFFRFQEHRRTVAAVHHNNGIVRPSGTVPAGIRRARVSGSDRRTRSSQGRTSQ